MGDLKRPGWMHLKGGLFVGIAVCVSAFLIMFHVIEHYIDGDCRFSGVGSFIRHVIGKRKPRG